MDWGLRKKSVNENCISFNLVAPFPKTEDRWKTHSFAEDEFNPELVQFESRYKK